MKAFILGLLSSTVLLAACGGAPDPSVGQSSEELSGSGSVAKAKAPAQEDSTGATTPTCPPGEKRCLVEETGGECKTVCITDTALCVAPKACASTAVCRAAASSIPPRPGCAFDVKTCSWDCPVCDPLGGPPRTGCTWNSTTCVWDCPVCDPSSPSPGPGCKWDGIACEWLCV